MGRPKGSLNKAATGLSFEKRMKILAKIIQDENEKSANRLSAIKQMTEMLADKVQVINTNDSPITTIKFEEDTKKIAKDIPKNTNDSTIQPKEEKPVINPEPVKQQPLITIKPFEPGKNRMIDEDSLSIDLVIADTPKE